MMGAIIVADKDKGKPRISSREVIYPVVLHYFRNRKNTNNSLSQFIHY
jgi:hypothetical protein